MALPFAFATLLTSDSYLPGALALVGALKDVHPSPPVPPEVDFQTVCLVTPETVDVTTIKLLRRAFNVVIGVELIEQEDAKGLNLLGRPDLHAVLTKLHIFRLTQYTKVIFLDADVLPIRPLSHLFHIAHPFSAVPDVGWPDIFNSGVLVISPGEDKFEAVRAILASKGTWDGGDQGVLNEWRGDDWNRLSFTYNTTPTAAYTYAPAYERFGSQISAIHFIGPNKPWSSISYRAPGSSSSSQNQATMPQAYDYDSLVDRWYEVYDAHYRSHSIVPESEFEVQKYVSAWDEETGTGAELLVAGGGATTGGALGLDDLRRLAVEGMGVASGKGTGGEGQYMSLPLDGRVDLMRHLEEKEEEETVSLDGAQLRTPVSGQRLDGRVDLMRHLEEKEVEGIGLLDGAQLRTPVSGQKELAPGSPPRMVTLPTPGPEELPPTPYLRGHSLPPAPVPGWRQQEQPSPSPAGPQQKHDAPVPYQQQRKQERPRIPSPPLLSWNPSIEPPPNITPTSHAFPSDTYFPNVWDQSHQSTHLDDTPSSGKPGPDSQGFFEVPPPSEIPEELLRQGHYRNVTGPHSDHSTATPDKAKVKSVFPWEEKPRHLPGRIFPGSESPPPGMIFQKIEVTAPEEVTVTTPEKQTGGRVYATPSPLNIGFPPNLTYANAWDTVPQITKYANRLVKPAPWALPSPSLVTPSLENPHRKKKWDDRAEVSSRDGDDEGDDEDESDENEAAPVGTRRWDDSVDDTKTLKTRSRSGSGNESISASRALRGKYRMQGVQTIRRVKRSMGVQAPDSEDEKKFSPPQTKLSMGSDESPLVVARTTTLSPDQITQPFKPTSSFPAAHPASGLRSPREVTSPQGNSPPSSPPRPGPNLKASGPPPQLIERQSSTETNVTTTSPASSIGPISPTDSQPIMSPLRRAVRVWDPARGVDLFKRGSEEVLAKFLKMGSWDSESTAQQHHA